ncbi:MAG: hypothetical protein E7613_08020 [Ruminococcaceae bacterium]|nr:hypothetical protein [Oscillospiraceae bacterium]
MIISKEKAKELLKLSVQVNNGLTDTSGDGATLVFDKKYGIMFCAYMPGRQGRYGESRGRIALSYFPASQPTNIRFVTIAEGDDVYCHNALGMGEGRVRVFYEKNSHAEGDHNWCYKDYDFLHDTLSEEQTVYVKHPDGEKEPLTLSVQFRYLEERGYHNHTYLKTEQIGHCGYFRDEYSVAYGACVSYLAEPILFRSYDDGATVEFFAVYPKPAQYEFEYKLLGDRICAIYRTNKDINAIGYSFSDDGGVNWAEPEFFKNSIQCRPRIINYDGTVLMCCNYFNDDTQNRPSIQQGRTSVCIFYGEERIPVADLYSKCGLVNVSLCDILNDIYFAYSTSELALEYQNGNPAVRGKDAVRYVKLGDLIPKE